MPLNAAQIGAETAAVDHDVDARWLMAYAAGIGDTNPRYHDTCRELAAHPLFPVCLEWPAILAARGLPGSEALLPGEETRGVHAAHDLHLLRPIGAGERLSTRATVVDVRGIRPGAAQLLRLDTVDAGGKPLCRTYQLSISRDVAVTGSRPPLEEAPPWPEADRAVAPPRRWPIPVGQSAAHVYTECARIYNPIHTDRAVALKAGLPDIILHGTATLAMAVSRLVNDCLGGDPARVRRIGGRFRAMVLMPSTLTLEVHDEGGAGLFFRVLTQQGEPAIDRGFLVTTPLQPG